ncbi:MAG: zinc-dependent alcohol dehydrogenase, partial [Gemmatimonadota bacterium]
MKQVVQRQADGQLRVADVPRPASRRGGVVVRNAYSLISAGTERSTVEVARKSLVGKARARPDQVRQVLDSVRQQGLAPTYQKVRGKLDQLSPLGYSSAGVVVEVGEDGGPYRPGDAVACAGGGYAVHAEYVFVPRNLCAPAEGVPLEAAAFGTVGAIALQGVRQADVRVGEVVAVIGLGLIGLITVQLLKAAGCRVLGVEPDEARARLARSLGCDATAAPGDAAVERAAGLTGGVGVDAALITAATAGSGPVSLAGTLCRDRGTVVMVGATGMEVPRSIYYDKELSFRLSRSYGPGRYDPTYEEKGQDYPIGYVRWTEGRNLAAFLDLVAQEKVRVEPLISHRFPIDHAARAYDLITGDEPHLGVLLRYDAAAEPAGREPSRVAVAAEPRGKGGDAG